MRAPHASNKVDAYIQSFPPEERRVLQTLRETIRAEAPDAEETIKYRMPTFVYHGNLIFFAAFKNHIGLYPTPSAIEHFKEELAGYVTSKGAIQFPKEKPLPLPLIRDIVRFRVAQANKTLS